MTLLELKKKAEEIISQKTGRNVVINIHVSTEMEDIKANVQGNGKRYDILIAAFLPFEKYPQAVAHELAHIILQSESHDEKHTKLTKKLLEEIKGKEE